MIFLGFLFDNNKFDYYKKNIKSAWFQAGAVFQWNIINGFIENGTKEFKIINCVPVGTFPTKYKKLFLPTRNWDYNGIECYEIGSINLPFFKQKQRERKLYNFLKKQKDGEEIFVFSPNLIFLNVLNKLKHKKKFKITLLITDIPEFYDLSNKKTNFIRQQIINKSNRLLHIADKYILLTSQMADYLNIDKPYLVIEAIANINDGDNQNIEKFNDKVFFYGGLLHERFGVKNLLDAFDQITNENFKLILCGDGDLKEEICKRAGKDKRVQYLGNIDRDKVLELQKKSTILINPRQNIDTFTKYSFPSKTIEYMLSGNPVVMYKLDGIPDEYDKYLCYVEDNSVESLKNKMLEVSNWSEHDRNKFGQAAKDFVISRKNKKFQTEKIINFMKE